MSYRIFLFFIGVVFLFLFIAQYSAYAEERTLTISEVYAAEATGYEWVEVFHEGNTPITIDNWFFWEANINHSLTLTQGTSTIYPGEFFIIAQNSELFLQKYSVGSTTVFDSSWGSLNEGGEDIGIKQPDGTMVDYVTYGSSTQFSVEKMNSNTWKEHPNGHSVAAVNYWQLSVDEPPEEIATTTTTEPAPLIIINEVMPNPDDEKEWVELLNVGTTTATLADWYIEDGVNNRISVSTTIGAQELFVIEFTNAILNNKGDVLLLKNTQGDVVDSISYGSWQNASSVSPKQGQSIARDPHTNGSWQVSMVSTKGQVNTIVAPEVERTDHADTPPSIASRYSASVGDVVINEMVSDPSDEGVEFVELYNRINQPIDLADWYIEDGANTKTVLNASIPAYGFLVIEKPKGSLNNAGDRVTLYTHDHQLLDSVTYGNWNDDNLNDNAPVAKDPQSLSRIVDGADSDVDAVDFAISDVVSMGKPNGIVSHRVYDLVYSTDIIINELFPNPQGEDSDDEVIELYNRGSERVSVRDWQLSDSSKKVFRLGDLFLDPRSYLFIDRAQTGIALNNSGTETVLLLSPSGNVMDRVDYSGPVQERMSYARFDSAWAWTDTFTPGMSNSRTPAEVPVADMNIPSSTLNRMMNIVESPHDMVATSSYYFLQISEIVPNPTGSDDQEFIELFNAGVTDIDLSGLLLDDAEGGSKPHSFENHVMLPAQQYVVFARAESGLALNNSGDQVRIIDENGKVITEISYDGSVEGASYSQNELGTWTWSMTLTPGETNVIAEPDVLPASLKKTTKEKARIATTIAGAKQQDSGDLLEVYGVVAVLPGVYGTQYFYLVDDQLQAIQVYMYSKDFPTLTVGDGVYVRGELSMTNGESRIKTKEQQDIVFHDHPGIEEPQVIDIASLKEQSGELVQLHGEVTEVKSSYLYVDDGTDEIKVYLKRGAGIPKQFVHVGDLIQVSGITVASNTDIQLLPRSKEDIIKTGVVDTAIIDHTSGEPQRNEQRVAETYVSATAGGISAILFGLLAKEYGARVWQFGKYMVKKYRTRE